MNYDQELRKLYQRAMAVCHPDRAPAHLHAFLEEKAKELNAAKQAGSFARIRKIAEELGVKDIPPMPESESAPEPQPKSESAPQKPKAKRRGRRRKKHSQHARKSQAEQWQDWVEPQQEEKFEVPDEILNNVKKIVYPFLCIVGGIAGMGFLNDILLDKSGWAGPIIGTILGYSIARVLSGFFPKTFIILGFLLGILLALCGVGLFIWLIVNVFPKIIMSVFDTITGFLATL